jgi:hypothetical protein
MTNRHRGPMIESNVAKVCVSIEAAKVGLAKVHQNFLGSFDVAAVLPIEDWAKPIIAWGPRPEESTTSSAGVVRLSTPAVPSVRSLPTSSGETGSGRLVIFKEHLSRPARAIVSSRALGTKVVPALGSGNEAPKSIDEARLAVVQRANPAHRLLLLGGQSRGPITISGPRKMGQRRLVVQYAGTTRSSRVGSNVR